MDVKNLYEIERIKLQINVIDRRISRYETLAMLSRLDDNHRNYRNYRDNINTAKEERLWLIDDMHQWMNKR